MRLELLTEGVHPGPLFSSRDRTLRKFLAKKKVTESHKLMVTAAAATNNIDELKKSFRQFSNALWYEDFTKERDKEMMDYYNKYVKHLRPELTRDGKSGEVSVKGLK